MHKALLTAAVLSMFSANAATAAPKPESASEERQANLNINVSDYVDILLTDSQGHREGHDAASGKDFDEIPEADYSVELPTPTDDSDVDDSSATGGQKIIHIDGPAAGTYNLEMTGLKEGEVEAGVDITGPGGSLKQTTTKFNSVVGKTTAQKIIIPTFGKADLSLAQTSFTPSIKIGGVMAYKFTVSNKGPDAASVLQFTNTMLGAKFTSVKSTKGDCRNFSDEVIGCDFDSLKKGEKVIITATAVPAEDIEQALDNYGYITGFETDLVESNNRTQHQTVVKLK